MKFILKLLTILLSFQLTVSCKVFQKQSINNRPNCPIVYSDKYDISFFGIENFHPFDSKKYGKVAKYLQNNLKKPDGSSLVFHVPDIINDQDLLNIHTKQYLTNLNHSKNVAQIAEISALMLVPNYFLQRNLLDPMKYATQGTILGSQLSLQNKWSINLAGGYHHAKSDCGGGFCFFADIPIAVYKLFKINSKYKVMIIDLDAHQGNGYADIFKNDPRIAIFDVYNAYNYPMDHQAKKYIKYNFPVRSFIKDREYLEIIKNNLPRAINEFKPDLVIYNAGTDVYEKDPLGKMSISKNGIIERDFLVFKYSIEKQIPILMLLSGGYSKDSANIIGESIVNIVRKFKLLK